jgi:hypothetical protein
VCDRGPDPAKSTEEQEGVEADPTRLNPEAVTKANREVGELTAPPKMERRPA